MASATLAHACIPSPTVHVGEDGERLYLTCRVAGKANCHRRFDYEPTPQAFESSGFCRYSGTELHSCSDVLAGKGN